MRRFATIWMLFLTFAGVSMAGAAPENATELLRAGHYQQLDSVYSSLQRKFEQGAISGENLRDAFRVFYPTDADLAKQYDGWVNAFPKSYVARLARGIYYKKVGFEERGDAYLSQTGPDKIKRMDVALQKAAADFGDSIALSKKPFLSYFHMIDIGRNYAGSDQTRQLYDHAISLDRRSFAVRVKYMTALETKWGGSSDAMRAFLEECRNAHLSDTQFHTLESMVYENEGWERTNDGDDAGAERAYRKAVALQAADCSQCLMENLTTILMRERKYSDAIYFFDRYLQSKPADTWALTNRGVAYLELGKSAEALADWKISAAAGDAFSQNRLGVLYMTGIQGQLAPDLKLGVEWLRKSAAQGNVDAQQNLLLALAQSEVPAGARRQIPVVTH